MRVVTCGQCEHRLQLAWMLGLGESRMGGSLLGEKSSGDKGDCGLAWILPVTDPS